MNINPKIILRFSFYVLMVTVIFTAVMGDLTCTFNIRDAATREYVIDPNISSSPGITQIAAPGTGGGRAP